MPGTVCSRERVWASWCLAVLTIVSSTSRSNAAAEQVTGGAHCSGGDRGLREHTTAQQDGDFMRVDRVVFGLATMDGLHGEGMTEDKRDTVFSTEVRKPVPGKQACGRQDDLIMVRSDGLEQRLWGRGHVAV